MAKPLYQLMERDKIWEFGEKQSKAFEKLVHRLTHAPILAYYNAKKAVTIETNAPKYVTPRIISLVGNDRILRDTAFCSISMSKSECNYSQ